MKIPIFVSDNNLFGHNKPSYHTCNLPSIYPYTLARSKLGRSSGGDQVLITGAADQISLIHSTETDQPVCAQRCEKPPLTHTFSHFSALVLKWDGRSLKLTFLIFFIIIYIRRINHLRSTTHGGIRFSRTILILHPKTNIDTHCMHC